jgi:hypothetical protein
LLVFNISAVIAVAVLGFTLKMVTAMFAETLENIQHLMWFIPEIEVTQYIKLSMDTDRSVC